MSDKEAHGLDQLIMLKQIYRLLNPRWQTVFLDYKVDQKPRYGHGKPPHKGLLELIDKNRSAYAKYLKHILTLKDQIWSLDQKLKDFSWDNGYLPGLDIVSLYGMIAYLKPQRYIEVGSGNSTMIVHQAIKDHSLTTKIVSLDPNPRAAIDEISHQVIRSGLEEIDLKVFDELQAGDVLFIDNSHRILPNSDSTVFFLEVLPRLEKGVVVHIHDIYLPYDYPQFMCDRSYSEQYGLAIALLSNPSKYEILLPNYYISEDKELATLISPLWGHGSTKDVERHGGSFWFWIA